MEYSKEINSLLGNPKSAPTSVIEDPKAVLKVDLCLYFLDVKYKALSLIFFYCLLGSWGTHLFKRCMGANGDVLCWQAIPSLDLRTASWLVGCMVIYLCFYISNHHLYKFIFYSFYCEEICLFPPNLPLIQQDYDSLFSGTHPTVHLKVVDFQKDLVALQVQLIIRFFMILCYCNRNELIQLMI